MVENCITMTSSERHDKVGHKQNGTKSDIDRAEIESQITLRPRQIYIILTNLEEKLENP